MRRVKLGPPIRESDDGTTSPLVLENGKQLCLIEELPDRGDTRNRSRVHGGLYRLRMSDSPHHGHVYRLCHLLPDGSEAEVEAHDHVLLHIGNLAGDVEKGYCSDSEACLLPGTSRALFRAGEKVGRHVLTRDQEGVASSGVALKAIYDEFNGEPFELEINRGGKPNA